MKTYPERWLWLYSELETRLERKREWTDKQEVGTFGLPLLEERWHRGYETALQDVLSLMDLVVKGNGKPPSTRTAGKK